MTPQAEHPRITRLEKTEAVHAAMVEVGLSFSDFLEEFLTTKASSLQRIRSIWLSYRSDRQYGPLRLVQLLSEAVRSAGDDGALAYDKGVASILSDTIADEKDQASHVPGFRSSDFLKDSSAPETNQLRYLSTLMEEHLPVTLCVADCLCGTINQEGPVSDGQKEIDGHITEDPPELSESRQAAVVCLSLALNLRSERMNRLQTVLGLFLRFKHTPKPIHTMLHRLGLATCPKTSSRHLVEFNKISLTKAKTMMQNPERVHTLVYDNFDIYVQELSNRVTSATRVVNLTCRMVVELPESFSSADISTSILSTVNAPRDLKESEVLGDDAFLTRAAHLFLAQELLQSKRAASDPQSKRVRDTIRLLRDYIRDLRDAHRVDELSAARWQVAPLPLIEANEGSLDGTLAVMEDTSIILGVYDEVEIADPTAASQTSSSSPNQTRWDIRRSSVLPKDGVLLVVGDLKTHRNAEAALKGRSRHTKAEDSGWIRCLFVAQLGKQRKDLATWTPSNADAVRELVDAVRNAALTEPSIYAAELLQDEFGANARRFLRDALLAIEWSDVCRTGDVGRMLMAQRFLAVAFAGVGKHQYSQTCLDEIWAHKVLPVKTWRTLAAARLINRFGVQNGFIGADLYQEHLNKELQRVDTKHGAATAVSRLRDCFSAVAEISRSLNDAHPELSDKNGRRLKDDDGHVKDVERVSNLAQQDGLFDVHSSRLSNETLAARVSRKPKPNAAGVPTGMDLIADLLPTQCGTDVLEKGLNYLRAKGLQQWKNARSAWCRYEALLREGGVTENLETDQDEGLVVATEEDAVNVPRLLDSEPDILSDDARRALEEEQMHRNWLRREEEAEAELALVDEDITGDGGEEGSMVRQE
ncbi:hypothetical protein A4X06_0g7974 [Tilletia controversa]|uniref:DUF6589 domain-containing protein n=1 Tax=Tilletia controversa TaxID=13291 RepID=A0A8X7MKV1_9BASI|nr:hypothetical protein A4X06_0g7974 [Tilletia controversa]